MWLQQLHDDDGDRSFLDVSTSPSLFSSNNPNNTTTKIASDIDIIQPISSVESTTRTSNIKNNTKNKIQNNILFSNTKCNLGNNLTTEVLSSKTSSISTESSSSVKNNQGVPVGILKENLAMWHFSCKAIKNKTQAKRVLSIIERGMSLDFETPPSPQGHIQKNYVNVNSKEGKWVTKQIRILLQQGSVRRVHATQATFTLPIFVVPKDGGNGLRMIVDMRELNKLLKKHRFTLPTLQRDRAEFNNLLGCWTYDLTSSYQHIEIAKDDQQYFGIEWEGQTYLMTVCPYGCSTVPELFQTVAGTPLKALETIGFCPDITTVEGWRRVAAGIDTVPHESRRFLINTKQYLDDYCSLLPPVIRTLDGQRVSGDALRKLAPALSKSFCTFMQAHGWTISSKSQPNPFATTKFLGFNIHTSSTGGTFSIPTRKREKNLRFFQQLLQSTTWTGRQAAQAAGRILQWKLIWGPEASLLARPIYQELSGLLRKDQHAWFHHYTPSTLSKQMVEMVISFIEPESQHFWDTSPIVETRDQLKYMFDSSLWLEYAESCGASAPDIVLTDASDHATGMWLATCSITEALATDELAVRSSQKSSDLQAWLMLPPDAIPESSTYRELLGVYDFYNNELMMTHITTRMTQYDKQGLLHLLDSQAAVAILRKGASKSPECHRLVLQIYNKTRDLRVNHGLIFSWVPREQNRAADALSKMHDWCITPTAFQRLNMQHHFTLDAFASKCELAAPSLAFCSRYLDTSSTGNSMLVPWSGHRVWAYPPHNTTMITLAIRKYVEDTSIATMALCVPTWYSAPWWQLVWNAPWSHFKRLRPGSASKICGLSDDNITLKQQWTTYPLTVFIFSRKSNKSSYT